MAPSWITSIYKLCKEAGIMSWITFPLLNCIVPIHWKCRINWIRWFVNSTIISSSVVFSFSDILFSGVISTWICRGLNIRYFLNLNPSVIIIIIYIKVNMISINVIGICVCLIWINGLNVLMLSNESFESFDIRYSDTKKYCLAVIYSTILWSTLE